MTAIRSHRAHVTSTSIVVDPLLLFFMFFLSIGFETSDRFIGNVSHRMMPLLWYQEKLFIPHGALNEWNNEWLTEHIGFCSAIYRFYAPILIWLNLHGQRSISHRFVGEFRQRSGCVLIIYVTTSRFTPHPHSFHSVLFLFADAHWLCPRSHWCMEQGVQELR